MNAFCLITYVSLTLSIGHSIAWKSHNLMSNKEFTYVQKAMSWADAANYCENLGGQLAHIEDAVENEFVKSLTGQSSTAWLGGSDIFKSWQWISPGKPMSYKDFYTGEPNQDGPVNCLQYWNFPGGYKWNDNLCQNLHFFICERTKEKKQDRDKELPDKVTWKTPNDKSNKEFTYIQMKKSWADAAIYCDNLGGQLANIDDAAENEFAKSLTGRRDPAWLGGSDIFRTWQWLNPGAPMVYKDFSRGEPNRDATVNCFLYWNSNDGYKWGDNPCQNGYFFICERKRSVKEQRINNRALTEKEKGCLEEINLDS